jgi:phenylacetate-CoA ligase
MSFFKKIVLENLLLPIGDFVLGTEYIKSLKEWRIIQLLNENELEKLQNDKLLKLLNHAQKNIPFYQNINKDKQIDIKDFPIVNKTIHKKNIDLFLLNPENKNSLICEKSSGSSGIQGTVYMSKKEQSKIQALQTLMWEWAGYEFGWPMLQTGMSSKRSLVKRMKDIILNINYELAFGLDPSGVIEALEKINKKTRPIIGGYASSMYVYAKIAKENNIRIKKFKSVISWGDKMFDQYRKLIEEVFSCKVHDIYGTTEGFVISGQKDSIYQYIFTPQVYLELLDENGNEVNDGEIGHVVVTHLDAYEMPLIRYTLGDLAIKLPKSEYPSNKSLSFPMFKKIIGRDTDIIYTQTGKSLIVHFFTGIFEYFPEIKQFRVIQNNLNSITIEYIVDKNFSNQILVNIENRIIEELKEKIIIVFEKVEFIPNTASGKPQIILSTLSTKLLKNED